VTEFKTWLGILIKKKGKAIFSDAKNRDKRTLRDGQKERIIDQSLLVFVSF